MYVSPPSDGILIGQEVMICSKTPSWYLLSWAGITGCRPWEGAYGVLLGSTPVEGNRIGHRIRLNFMTRGEIWCWDGSSDRSKLGVKGPGLYISKNKKSLNEGCLRKQLWPEMKFSFIQQKTDSWVLSFDNWGNKSSFWRGITVARHILNQIHSISLSHYKIMLHFL